MDELLLDVGPQRVAQVAIERGIDRYPEGLTYALPADLESIPVGSRVVVPLGPSNTPTPGWVLRIQTHEDAVALAPLPGPGSTRDVHQSQGVPMVRTSPSRG